MHKSQSGKEPTLPICLDLSSAFAAQARYFDILPFVSRLYPTLLDNLLGLCLDYYPDYLTVQKNEHAELLDDIFSQAFDVIHLEITTSSLNAIAQEAIEAQLFSESFYTVIMDILTDVLSGLHGLGPYFAGIDLVRPLIQQQPYVFFYAKQSTAPNHLYVRK